MELYFMTLCSTFGRDYWICKRPDYDIEVDMAHPLFFSTFYELSGEPEYYEVNVTPDDFLESNGERFTKKTRLEMVHLMKEIEGRKVEIETAVRQKLFNESHSNLEELTKDLQKAVRRANRAQEKAALASIDLEEEIVLNNDDPEQVIEAKTQVHAFKLYVFETMSREQEALQKFMENAVTMVECATEDEPIMKVIELATSLELSEFSAYLTKMKTEKEERKATEAKRVEAEAKARAETEAKARAEAEAKRVEAEAKARADTEAKARAEAEAKARAEAKAKAAQEAQAKAAQEAQAKAAQDPLAKLRLAIQQTDSNKVQELIPILQDKYQLLASTNAMNSTILGELNEIISLLDGYSDKGIVSNSLEAFRKMVPEPSIPIVEQVRNAIQAVEADKLRSTLQSISSSHDSKELGEIVSLLQGGLESEQVSIKPILEQYLPIFRGMLESPKLEDLRNAIKNDDIKTAKEIIIGLKSEYEALKDIDKTKLEEIISFLTVNLETFEGDEDIANSLVTFRNIRESLSAPSAYPATKSGGRGKTLRKRAIKNKTRRKLKRKSRRNM
jgi:chemotaxis protein histidine kinase CheA